MADVMTPEQIAHRAYIVKEAAFLINEKYAKGAAEHKTNLKEDTSIAQLLDFAIEEAVDQIVYLLTLKQKCDEQPYISSNS